MDKHFFANYAERKSTFEKHVGDTENVRGQLVLVNGRTYLIDEVTAVEDSWVQVVGRELNDENTVVCVSLPYHQIGHVVFVRRRTAKGGTGFIS